MTDTRNLLKPQSSGDGGPPSPEAVPEAEAELIRRLRKGQEWAYRTLVSDYQERLLKIAYGITLDHEESREIVQDVFINAIAKISGFRGERGLGPWLRKITVNASLNWKRKWKRRFRWQHTPLEADTEFLVYDKAADGETPETRLREKQEERALARAVAQLPEAIRAVFVLNALEGMSYKEISETLGIKEGTVSSRLYRARKMILNAVQESETSQRGTP